MADSSDFKEGAGVIDDELLSIRQRRLEFLKKKREENLRALAEGGGVLKDILESEFFPIVTSKKWVIASFYHHQFSRCSILHDHLTKLAAKYPAITFLKMDVEKCPFLVTKLKIRILPVMLFFKNGINTGRCVGFEEFGNKDDFPTILIEEKMEKEGMIVLDESAVEAATAPKDTSSKTLGSSLHSTTLSSKQSEIQKMREKIMQEEDDDDIFG
ncbi:Protein disulfide-isomerase, active site divergent [Monocercomonoides exilis]|uniref:Protein disulfide-isomerase, active site divergent n=1 Tax=Monocercomonoides exilis TaxID=2049356 RepID=UPI00355AC32C|nr:Protein disulfide-isomerase, active site divergent [Monocercomonoides exilis]|eukprot:MONOS_9640.1-p1 / transcript=MONOS_9640.1 / gene=MONOS_9640 / organism=Monocercomonoides_exilis_PA203 / gene_product=Protein disulfide-isomerase, active site divergent / transcript_product=Protein disulfide-isomerase, active site divergent / location=Mono_scaffold00404:53256-54195(+) / protein_length=214 / sequence_SO=supercontig / SO=protein_coding / is_pseudo=false